MANQVIVTNTGNVQVAIEPTPNVQVQISRAAINAVTNVPTANFANYAGNVTVSAQPNITSVGTLTGLTVSGNATVTNLNVTGNLSVGNLVANTANYANFANVSNIANSVAVSNVTGIGNIATVNLDGNVSNVLSGNGSFVPLPTVSANANYANFAGTAFNVSGSNVTGAVANATYANNAGNATVASSANSVTAANVSGLGNVALLNLDGNVSNVLSGNGSFVALPTVSANANYANFAGTAFNVSGANVSGEVANANYATFAGTAYSVSGSNVVGEVSNANYATYSGTAGVANSVAGANVVGEVANANYASYANISNVANSVAVANVVGIGNIATTNFDGNGQNALLGNGAWGPVEVTSNIISNGTSNVSIPVSNGNVNISTNGNANIAQFDTNGALFLYPTTSSTNGLRINSYGNPVSGDVSRIASYRARGNASAPLSVQPNDNLMRLLAFGHNGNIQQTNSTVSFRATVDSSYTANTANIPVGWNMSVNDTNGGVNNQAKTHNFYSNGNVQFAQGATFGNTSQDTVFKVLGNNNNGYAEFNGVSFRVYQDNSNGSAGYSPFFFYTYQSNNDFISSSKFYRAAGTQASPAAVSNGSNIAINQYAAYADSGNTYKPVFQQEVTVTSNDGVGNLTGNMNFYAYNTGSNINLQASNTYADIMRANYFVGDGSNLTNIPAGNLTGNLTYLNVVDSANVTGTIQQLAPNTITITTNSTNNTAYDLTTIYGETSNIVESGQRAIIRSRGNVSTPATAVVNDVGARDRVYFYNGTTNAVGFATSVVLSNLNSNSNAYSTGASYNISVGNPNGDQGNANANSAFNLFQFNQNGQLLLLPGANSSVGSMLSMFSYGQPTNLGQSQGITMSKARGNRDANLSVNAGDTIGRIVFQAHNGTGFVTNRLPIIRSTVDSSYTANTANIPAGFQVVVCDNTTNYTHNFYANGITALAGNLTMGASQTIEVNRINQTGSGALTVYGPTTFNQGISSEGGSFTGNSDVSINGSTNGTPKNVYIGDFINGNLNFTLNGNFTQSKGNVFLSTSNVFLYNGGNSLTLQGVADSANGKYANLSFDYGQFNAGLSTGGNLSVGGSFNAGNLSANNFTVGNYSNSNSYTANIWANTSMRGNVTLSGYDFFSNTYSPLRMQFGYGNVSLQILDGNIQVSNANGNGGYVSAVSFNGDVLNIGTGNALILSNGQANVANLQISSNGFSKLASYTATALNAITGQIGWMAAVSDSASGSNPNGMIAFWDTTNNRWSYVHDNSAV